MSYILDVNYLNTCHVWQEQNNIKKISQNQNNNMPFKIFDTLEVTIKNGVDLEAADFNGFSDP